MILGNSGYLLVVTLYVGAISEAVGVTSYVRPLIYHWTCLPWPGTANSVNGSSAQISWPNYWVNSRVWYKTLQPLYCWQCKYLSFAQSCQILLPSLWHWFSTTCQWNGHVALTTITGTTIVVHLFKPSYCNSFEDWILLDKIRWVTVTRQEWQGIRIVAPTWPAGDVPYSSCTESSWSIGLPLPCHGDLTPGSKDGHEGGTVFLPLHGDQVVLVQRPTPRMPFPSNVNIWSQITDV